MKLLSDSIWRRYDMDTFSEKLAIFSVTMAAPNGDDGCNWCSGMDGDGCVITLLRLFIR